MGVELGKVRVKVWMGTLSVVMPEQATGTSYLCGPCLPGCSEPSVAGPGRKASPRPNSKRAAAKSAPTWCRKPTGQVKEEPHGLL